MKLSYAAGNWVPYDTVPNGHERYWVGADGIHEASRNLEALFDYTKMYHDKPFWGTHAASLSLGSNGQMVYEMKSHSFGTFCRSEKKCQSFDFRKGDVAMKPVLDLIL